MKEQLLELVKNIQAEGHDISEQPIIFKWSWDDDLPGIGFQLLIHGTTPIDEVVAPNDEEEDELLVVPNDTTTLH